MKFKNLALIFMFIFLLFTFVSAQDVILKNGESENLVVTCTNNGTFCSNSATANVTIVNPNGILLVDNMAMTKTGSTFNYTISELNTTTNGEYLFVVSIIDDGTTFSKSLIFTVTPSGTLPSVAQGLIYLVLMVVMLCLFGISFFFAIYLNGKNNELFNNVITINPNKYYKLILFYVSYLMLVFVMFFAMHISYNFLFETDLFSLFETIHNVLWITLLPMTIVLLIMIGLNVILDKKLTRDTLRMSGKRRG